MQKNREVAMPRCL